MNDQIFMEWDTADYHYTFTIDLNANKGWLLNPPPFLELLRMAKEVAEDLQVTPENCAEVNAGGSWAIMTCEVKA